MAHGPGFTGPAMTLAEADEAVVRMRTDHGHVTGNLLDLENSVGYRFLNGGALHGRTLLRWQETSRDLAQLWRLFDAYQRVLEAAEAKRTSQRRPGAAELRELTDLLHGPSIELPEEERALTDRSLLDPRRDHATPKEVLDRMVEIFDRATTMVATAEAAWNVLHPLLREVEKRHEEAAACVAELGNVPEEFAALSAEVDRIRATVRGDPLTLVRSPSGAVEIVDPTVFDELVTRLGEVRERLSTALSLRDSGATVLTIVREEVREVIEETRVAALRHTETRVRIAAPSTTPVPNVAEELEPTLRRLDDLRSTGRWEDLARLLHDVRRRADALVQQVRAAAQANTALLDQRDELRGRLDAFRVKATRLGRAEDQDVQGVQHRAERLLWEAPCDLRAATEAVEQYQRALNERA